MTHKAIKDALEAGPTEGPWTQGGQPEAEDCIWIGGVAPPSRTSAGLGDPATWIDCITKANAAYIAAVNPTAIRALLAELEAKQAEIDRLMLEYCPDEMTPEQFENWARHQKPVTIKETTK